jgi:hypothetical protein
MIMIKIIATLITGLAICSYANANPAATNSILKGTFAADITNSLESEDVKGFVIGGIYENITSNNVHYRVGASLTSGREFMDAMALDGIIFDANLQKNLENKMYVFAGLNYAMIESSFTGNGTLTLESNGLGYQLGIGKNIDQQFNIEAVYQSLPLKGSTTNNNTTGLMDITGLRVGITYAL